MNQESGIKDEVSSAERRLKMVISYDGRPFKGWQVQPNGPSVQGHLQAAFEKMTGQPADVQGSGRTDAGVHAIGQVAHVDVDPGRFRMRPDQWREAINTKLPPEVRIMEAEFVDADFHARFSAQGKTYRYDIYNHRVMPPLRHGRAWLVQRPLDAAAMAENAQAYLGEHDFAAFAANRGYPETSTVRAIHSAEVTQPEEHLIRFTVSGSGFLYHMVRLMAGGLVRSVWQGARDMDIPQMLADGAAGPKCQYAAPAHGLYLLEVRY